MFPRTTRVVVYGTLPVQLVECIICCPAYVGPVRGPSPRFVFGVWTTCVYQHDPTSSEPVGHVGTRAYGVSLVQLVRVYAWC